MSIRELIASLLCETNIDEEVTSSHILKAYGIPDRKVGKWIDNNGLYQCSVCKHIWSELWWTSVCPIDRMNKMMRFCPNCGSLMKGEKSDLGRDKDDSRDY